VVKPIKLLIIRDLTKLFTIYFIENQTFMLKFNELLYLQIEQNIYKIQIFQN